MDRDSEFYNLPEWFDDFTFLNEASTSNPELATNFAYGLEIEDTSVSADLHNDVFPPSLDFGTQVPSLNDSPDIERLNDHESDSAFKFLDQILMEESIDEMPSMSHDHLALQATEKSFYDVIDKKYTPSPYIDMNTEFPNSLCETTCEPNGNSAEPSWHEDQGFYEFSVQQFRSSNRSIQSSFTSSQLLVNSVNSFRSNSEGQIDSSLDMNLISSQFSDSETKLQFWKGMEEARKFLPTNSDLIIDLDNNTLAPKPVKEPPNMVIRVEKDHSESIRGRKHHHHQDSALDARSSKQSAVYKDEIELSEMFDNFFIRDFEGVTVSAKGDVKFLNGYDKYWKQNRLPRVQSNRKVPRKRQGEETDAEYLQSLIFSCAKAAASDDLRNAQEQLMKIRQYASSIGEASQRVANIFANGLEARLSGTGTQIYAALASKRISASEMLKNYQVYHSACPFKGNSIVNAHRMILKIAAKGSNLHIVDFGISYGYHYPVLIQFLSIRQGGPPKLRITGIDFPQPGFRPSELIEETGRRLAKYCKRFNVPFEYQAIARHSWEKIDIDDPKLARDEVLVVNCFLQFQNLPEETVLAESPKDDILKLTRSMKPDLFVHTIVNGSYNGPFFLTRFREAFLYYASYFDMFDVTLPRNDLQRSYIEKEYFGREVVNVIACEGEQRVVRPETYKQWHLRTIRAGFKILPLEKEVILKAKLEVGYHKDFLFEEDGNWMLQGWKGRVLYGSSCWVPV